MYTRLEYLTGKIYLFPAEIYFPKFGLGHIALADRI